MDTSGDGMASTYLEIQLPSLEGWDVVVTSDPTFDYNCIAHAADDPTRNWWPQEDPDGTTYWPDGVPCEHTVAAFAKAYATLGYEVCSDEHFEVGYEKIAIYVDEDGKPAHASKQIDKHFWTSKLGGYHDIKHLFEALDALYGRVALIMRRPKVVPPERP